MKPDKFKQLVAKQDMIKGPETLGEPTEITNWTEHMKLGHRIRNFTKIQDMPNKQKQAIVHTPAANQYFLAVKESFCGYYYIWILCLTEGSHRVLFRVNSGDIQFVTWEIPEAEVK